MILKKITIENFRCFKNYEVDLTPGITVFIGKNGAGKTSLLNAIRYGLSVFFSNDSTMGDDLLISGNPDLKVISTLATDFYRAQNADLPQTTGYATSTHRYAAAPGLLPSLPTTTLKTG